MELGGRRWLVGVVLLALARGAAGVGCPNSAVLSNDTVVGTSVFRALQKISGGPSFTVKAGGAAILQSGLKVDLGSGFKIKSGGKLHVAVLSDPCPANAPPIAIDDVFVVGRGSSANLLDVLANDTDPDLPGDTLNIDDVGWPSEGGVASINGAQLSYTPPAGFTGLETFSYTISDGAGLQDTAEVFVLVSEFSCADTVAIMPLGDSITDGRHRYRRPLWFDLIGADYNVDFVGTEVDTCPEIPDTCPHDPDHEGVSGDTAADVEARVGAALNANPPDVVLLHIGTNPIDDLNDVQTQADVDAVDDILDAIDLFDTDIIVILARIINRMTPIEATTDYNADLASLAQQRIDGGDRIIVVDMETALDYPDDMLDELHPTQSVCNAAGCSPPVSGATKIRDEWFLGLASVLPRCP